MKNEVPLKLLMGNVEELFKALPQDHRDVYWDTLSKTQYEGGVPITRYLIRVTGLILLSPSEQLTLAEVILRCGSHLGSPHDEMDTINKEKVNQYKQQVQAEIEELADCHCVQLHHGILTANLTERFYGVVKEPQEVQP